jgi:hypothetical protein
MAASDSHFACVVGFAQFLEIIDERWKADRLSDDEVRKLWNTVSKGEAA